MVDTLKNRLMENFNFLIYINLIKIQILGVSLKISRSINTFIEISKYIYI